MRDVVVTCELCEEPFVVGADDDRLEAIQIYCDPCHEHLALEFCRTQKE